MDVTNLYTNMRRRNALPTCTTVCKAYERYHNNKPPIPTHLHRNMLKFIQKENSFDSNGKIYLQIQGTAFEMAVSFANQLCQRFGQKSSMSTEKPLVWKRYIDDGTLWNLSIEDIYGFINQANRNHPTIIKILNKETIFLDTCVYKSDWVNLEIHLFLTCKLTTSRQQHFSTHISPPADLPGVSKGFIKGEAIRLLRTNKGKHQSIQIAPSGERFQTLW